MSFVKQPWKLVLIWHALLPIITRNEGQQSNILHGLETWYVVPAPTPNNIKHWNTNDCKGNRDKKFKERRFGIGAWRRVGCDQKHKALWLKPLYWFHNFSLRLFLRTDSSPLENSDVTKCVAVEYPCSSPDLNLFLSCGVLVLKQSTTKLRMWVQGRFRSTANTGPAAIIMKVI